jgi:hypothetical protein
MGLLRAASVSRLSSSRPAHLATLLQQNLRERRVAEDVVKEDVFAGPFAVTGDLGWTVAVVFTMLPGALICLITLVIYSFVGTNLPCDVGGRLAACIVVPAACGGCALGIGATRTPLARALAGLAGALIIGGVVWWIAAGIFAAHCPA